MTVEEAWNRGNNLVATATLALAGIAFFPEAFLEPEQPFKIDDILLFVLGVGAVGWYKKANNRYVRSAVPVILTILGLFVKIVGVLIEFKDKEDVGDDFGGLILFLAATILVVFLYFRSRAPKK